MGQDSEIAIPANRSGMKWKTNYRRVYDLPENSVLTDGSKVVFRNGHCHSFALAMRQLTGWQVVGTKRHRVVQHVYCLMRETPDGATVVDADGAHKVNPERLCSLSGFKFSGWLKPRVEAALPFARSVLDELEQSFPTP